MFKDAFKYYKSKQPSLDLSKVIEVAKNDENVNVIKIKHKLDKHLYGLIPVESWKIYALKGKEGLIVIKNPFTAIGQRYWITRCLKDFTKKPQKLNIDAHNYLSEHEDWWEVCRDDTKRDLQKKLRWATLGYHHNWDTKVYCEANKDKFPDDLANLCEYIARVLGLENFRGEAAIINFYHMNSTLSGHTDHSEDNLDAPLFSFSFGQSAIFLIGGETEDCPAIPLFIHSGDVVVMSKESRLCYHAVPKILKVSHQPWNTVEEKCDDMNDMNDYKKYADDKYFKPFDRYVGESRINMNVRQVLRNEQTSLCNNPHKKRKLCL